jgi:hypothetical protein
MKNLASKNLSPFDFNENKFEKIESSFDYICISKDLIHNSKELNLEGFLCFICDNLACEPSMCSICQKLFCLCCKNKLLGLNIEGETKYKLKECPNCKNQLTTSLIPRIDQEKIENLQVKCLGISNNCGDIVFYRDYLNHLNNCKNFEGFVRCFLCSFIDEKSKMNHHLENCPKTIFSK